MSQNMMLIDTNVGDIPMDNYVNMEKVHDVKLQEW